MIHDERLPTIVHFMNFGRTPCGMPMPPANWPENHKWEADWNVVNCRMCIDVRDGKVAGPKIPNPLSTSAAEMIGAVMRKLRPLSAEEAVEREREHRRELAEHAALRSQQLISQAHAPARQLNVAALHVTGPWGETITKLASMLGTGFLIALIGKRGNGKTQLGVELIRDLSKRDITSLYATATEFFMDVKATYKDNAKESERDMIRRYSQRPLLVLDEIGKRGETDWEDRLLFELLDKRYRASKDTLLISNQDREKFEESVGPSIISRLNETGGVIECTWESFR